MEDAFVIVGQQKSDSVENKADGLPAAKALADPVVLADARAAGVFTKDWNELIAMDPSILFRIDAAAATSHLPSCGASLSKIGKLFLIIKPEIAHWCGPVDTKGEDQSPESLFAKGKKAEIGEPLAAGLPRRLPNMQEAFGCYVMAAVGGSLLALMKVAEFYCCGYHTVRVDLAFAKRLFFIAWCRGATSAAAWIWQEERQRGTLANRWVHCGASVGCPLAMIFSLCGRNSSYNCHGSFVENKASHTNAIFTQLGIQPDLTVDSLNWPLTSLSTTPLPLPITDEHMAALQEVSVAAKKGEAWAQMALVVWFDNLSEDLKENYFAAKSEKEDDDDEEDEQEDEEEEQGQEQENEIKGDKGEEEKKSKTLQRMSELIRKCEQPSVGVWPAIGLGHAGAQLLRAAYVSNGIKVGKFGSAVSNVVQMGDVQKEDMLQVSLALLQQAAAQGSPEASAVLSTCYLDTKGEFIPTDYPKGVTYAEEGARLGNANALWNLAICYYQGRGVRADEKQAAELLAKAAAAGHPHAKALAAEWFLPLPTLTSE